MDNYELPRKTRKVWDTPGDSHYLTFSTFDKRPYLLDERICRLLTASTAKASREHEVAILAYVFMPDHVHLMVHPLREEYSMAAFQKSMKQGVSSRAKNYGWITTDLWEVGGGYDSNISNPVARAEAIKYISQNPVRKELVDESYLYRWSSANWLLTGVQGDIPCEHFGLLNR